MVNKKTTLNVCPGGGCHTGCIHRTYIKDGKISKIERLSYPDGEEGSICLKGVAGGRLPYHPDRLKYPLKRSGERGEGEWERITWPQALDEIAAKITTLRGKYGPESIGMLPFYNSTQPRSGIQPMLGIRLQNLLEATDLHQGVAIDSNPLFSNYFTFGTIRGSFADPRTLIEGNTRYMIAWGTNPAEMGIRFMKSIREAQKRGAKLVDIGLMRDPTAQEADWWIPVKAGSDGALALAMIGVIINENLYDEGYVLRYTNGPFLVRTDNGRLLRESDIIPGGNTSKYVVWNGGDGRPEAVLPESYAFSGIKPALFGAYETGGIACRPAFQVLADLANESLPEEVERITGVSYGTVQKLAREFATVRPAAILTCCGLRYMNSGNAYRAMHILGAITGNIGALGGGTIIGFNTQSRRNAPQLKFNDAPILFPTEARARPIPMAQSIQCMITGKPYPIKALIMYFSNLVHTFPNPQRWIKDVFPELDLIVVNDIFMTATARYADYVLPDCTIFEREDIDVGHGGHIVLLEKAIEPLYECRPPVYFWSELAKRLGFGEYFNKTMAEWMELRLCSEDPSIAGIEPPLTLERLQKEKMVRANVPKETIHAFLDKEFLTPSGRLELYNEELVPAGDGLPVFREQLESPRSALAKKYPLVFNTANNKYFMHTIFANDATILKSYKTEPHLAINPQDAKERDIKEGDIVRVFNDRGNCKVRAMITESVPPGVVNLPHGWWPVQFIEGHLADLLLPLAGSETRDPAREIYWSVAAERLGISEETWFAYSPDTLADCLCEVKKVRSVQ